MRVFQRRFASSAQARLRQKEQVSPVHSGTRRMRQRPCSVRNTQSGRFSSLLSPLGKAGMPLSQRRIESPLFKENVQFAATGLTFRKANCTLYCL